MFDFLFEGRLSSVTSFSGITEESTNEEKREFCGNCLDAIRHGIKSGCLTSFIYYKDTSDFFDQYKKLILDYFEVWFDSDDFLVCMNKELELRDIIECNHYAKNFYVWAFVENVLFAREWDFVEAIEEYDNSVESNE